jgi:hypothetical protein
MTNQDGRDRRDAGFKRRLISGLGTATAGAGRAVIFTAVVLVGVVLVAVDPTGSGRAGVEKQHRLVVGKVV